MTEEMALKVLKLIQSSYPGESHKLEGDRMEATKRVMLALFSRTENAIVLQAAGKCIANLTHLPSLAEIRKAVKEIQNTIPEFKVLPESPLNAIGMERVREIQEKARTRWAENHEKEGKRIDPNDAEYYSFLEPELVQYVRRKMRDLTLQRIAENESEIRFNMENGGQLDGHPMGLVIDKFTGQINNHVFVDYRPR